MVGGGETPGVPSQSLNGHPSADKNHGRVLGERLAGQMHQLELCSV